MFPLITELTRHFHPSASSARDTAALWVDLSPFVSLLLTHRHSIWLLYRVIFYTSVCWYGGVKRLHKHPVKQRVLCNYKSKVQACYSSRSLHNISQGYEMMIHYLMLPLTVFVSAAEHGSTQWLQLPMFEWLDSLSLNICLATITLIIGPDYIINPDLPDYIINPDLTEWKCTEIRTECTFGPTPYVWSNNHGLKIRII